MSELDYCTKFAAHFASKAWDFKDDPDDFIQAIRLYEKAKQLLSQTPEPNPQEISEIDKKLAQVKADRQVWINEAKSRADLSKLQTEAVIDQRMNELKLEIVKNTVELAAIRQTLDAHYKALEQRVSDLDTAFTALQKNLKQLTDDIKDNKEDIRDLRHDYGRRIPKIIVRPRRQSR
jgi:chromosome segregation ATPase